MPNSFDLEALNDAMFVACHDERAVEIADKGFAVLAEIMGTVLDDISHEIASPERYSGKK